MPTHYVAKSREKRAVQAAGSPWSPTGIIISFKGSNGKNNLVEKSTLAAPMEARHHAKVENVFRAFDGDKNGSLNKSELAAALIAVGAQPECKANGKQGRGRGTGG